MGFGLQKTVAKSQPPPTPHHLVLSFKIPFKIEMEFLDVPWSGTADSICDTGLFVVENLFLATRVE